MRTTGYTRTSLTSDGRLGAWLLVLGPLLAPVLLYYAYGSSLGRQGPAPMLEILAWCGGVASVAAIGLGVVLLAIGRVQTHESIGD